MDFFDNWFWRGHQVDGLGPIDGLDFQTQMSCLRVNPLVDVDFVDGQLVQYAQDETLELLNTEGVLMETLI